METKNEEEEGDAPAEPVKEEVKTPPTSLDKYTVENDRRADLLKQETALQERKEKLHTEQMLSGGSNAGQAPVGEKKELSNKEYAEKITAGEIPDGD